MRDLPEAAINAAADWMRRDGDLHEHERVARAVILTALPHLEAAIRAAGPHLRDADLIRRHDDEGRRYWTLPFCDDCGMLGRRTLESPTCACGSATYSEAQVIERSHLKRAELALDTAHRGEAAIRADDEGRTHFIDPSDEARIRADEREKCAREVEADELCASCQGSGLRYVPAAGDHATCTACGGSGLLRDVDCDCGYSDRGERITEQWCSLHGVDAPRPAAVIASRLRAGGADNHDVPAVRGNRAQAVRWTLASLRADLPHLQRHGPRPVIPDHGEHRMTDKRITDSMSIGAPSFPIEALVGRTIIAVHPVVDSDRDESLLVCDDGTVVLLSCDPIRHDEQGVPILDPADWPGWEVVLYDATNTDAGRNV